jgi:archaellum component FlaC
LTRPYEVSAQLQSLHVTVSEFKTIFGHTAIKIDDVDGKIQTLVEITPKIASQVQALYDEFPGQVESILEQLNKHNVIYVLFFIALVVSAIFAFGAFTF